MTHLYLALFALLAAAAAADSAPTKVWWDGWEITSSEIRFVGMTHKGYPLTHLVDGNPKTAWVFNGMLKTPYPDIDKANQEQWGGPIGITFRPDEPAVLDGLRIMNGYNKAPETFKRNDRVTELLVRGTFLSGKSEQRFEKTALLSDKMGFHEIGLPRRRYTGLTMVVRKRVAGSGSRDVCISDIQLVREGKPINLKVPRAVLASDWQDCGCFEVADVMSVGGKVLAHAEIDEGPALELSPNGRFVVGVDGREGRRPTLWVVELSTGRTLLRRRVTSDVQGLSWEGNRKVVVEEARGEKAYRLP